MMDNKVSQTLQIKTAEENKLLHIGEINEDSESQVSERDSEIFEETTPLIKSGKSINSGDSSLYYDALESLNENEGIGVSGEIGSASDLQASLLLPAARLSSYSSMRKSTEIIKKGGTKNRASKSTLTSSLTERLLDERGVVESLAIANLLPFLIGSATFSLPYAVARGGFASIPIFVICTILADITGILLADALYITSSKTGRRKRVYLDYVELAQAAAGRMGSRMLNFVLIFYLYANNVVNLVLIGRSLFAILQGHVPLTQKAVTALFAILVIPPLFVKRLSSLAYLSIVSTLSIITGGIASVVVFVHQSGRWQANSRLLPTFDIEGLSYAISVWFFMVICHSVVPQVEGSMAKPTKYPRVLHISYSISTVVKICFGIMGALTFGASTNPIVSLNITTTSVNIIANLSLASYAVSSFPINFYVVCETFDVWLLKDRQPALRKGGKYHNYWILLTRPVLVGLGLAIAIFVPYFGLLVGVLGSILAIFLVFVFPCSFHLILKWRKLSTWRILAELIVLVAGLTFGVAGLYASSKGLIHAMQNGKT